MPLSEREDRWKKLHLPETKQDAQRLLLMEDMRGEWVGLCVSWNCVCIEAKAVHKATETMEESRWLQDSMRGGGTGHAQ